MAFNSRQGEAMSRIAIIYRGAVQELVALFMLLAAFGSSIHLATAVENSCSFDYVATDGLLASAFKEFPREVLLDHPELVKEARSALPDVRRIFASSLGYSALVGWAELPEDYSGYSNLQAERKLVEGVELGKRTVNAGKSVTYDTDFGPPISIFLVLNYQDNSKSWRDVAMDVIATSHCLFSIKISGATKPNDDAAWQAFHSELERIRVLINKQEGPVAFSKSGRLFSFWGVVNVGIFALVGVGIGGIIAFGLTRRYQIVPGKAARRYSLAIILLCLFVIGDVVMEVAYLLGTGFKTYDGVFLAVLVLAVHLNAYIRRSPIAVLAAVSLVMGLFVATALYIAVGWRALPLPGEAIGIIIGLAMLVYALAGTLSRTNPTEHQLGKPISPRPKA
jgi:hypothetical protein